MYRVRHAKRADMKYPTSAGKENPDLIKSGLRGEQNNASIDLNYIISNSLQRMVVQKEINRIDFFVAVF